MSDIKQITAVARDRSGKGAARAVRRQGQVPAVIYGAGQPATGIALDFNETKRLIFAGHFLTTIFEIDVDGKKTRAIPRDYQLDPVRDFPVHVDFLRLSKGQSIKVVVPVHVIGQDKSPGVKRGGTVNIVEHSIELLVPSDSIPDFARSLGGRPRHRIVDPPRGHQAAEGRQGDRDREPDHRLRGSPVGHAGRRGRSGRRGSGCCSRGEGLIV